MLSVTGGSVRAVDRPPTEVLEEERNRPQRAGVVFALVSVVPSLVLTAWLVTAFPLAALGLLYPIPALLAALVAAVLFVPLGTRLLRRSTFDAPWWTVVASAAIAVGFSIFTALSHDENVVLHRDPGAYAQVGYWLAHHGGVTGHLPVSAFGPSPGALSFASPAFYQVGDHLVPQFMTGWPTLLAAACWAGGWTGMFLLTPLVGGAAILAMAGLAARLIGPRWAPLVALMTALTWPVIRVSQTSYSEPLALLLLAGGMCLLVDLLIGTTRRGQRHDLRPHAFAAGLVLAGGELVRLDFGVKYALIIPVIGYLWARGRPEVRPFVVGSVIGLALGLADCTLVTLPYVKLNWSSVRLMIVALVLMTAGTIVAARILRRSGRSVRAVPGWKWVPPLAVAGLLLVSLYFTLRPYVQVDHSTVNKDVKTYTEQMQGWLGLPLDGTRGYVEQTLWWVSWYVGWPVLVVGLIGAAGLTWRVLRGRERRWLPVWLVYLGATVQTLLRPGITPDHPWADRRLVVEVIPGLILFAVWVTARTARLARAVAARRTARFGGVGRLGRYVAPAVQIALAAAFVMPIALVTRPLADQRTELGELSAVAQLCGSLKPNDSVVLMDGLWVPTIRAQCRLPVAQLVRPSPDTIMQTAQSIRAAGRTPVFGATDRVDLDNKGLAPQRVVDLRTRQDQHQLLQHPTGTDELHLEFWIVRQ